MAVQRSGYGLQGAKIGKDVSGIDFMGMLQVVINHVSNSAEVVGKG